jgi:hypothetical protein
MLRFLLAEAITSVPSSFDNIQMTIPDIGVHSHAKSVFPDGGRLIKTHELQRTKYRRAIYVIRDVRDVLLSNFGRETAMDAIPRVSLDDFVPLFMQGKMSRWGAWQVHVADWLDSPIARRGDLHVIRFEEMRADLYGTIIRALEFLGLEANSDAIQSAIVNNSLERMRAKEDNARTLPHTTEKHGRWIGQGAVYGWRQRLTPKQVGIVHAYAGEMLDRLGYLSATSLGYPSDLSSGTMSASELVWRSPVPISSARPGKNMTPDISNVRTRQRSRSPFQRLRRRVGGRTADTFSWYRH